MSQRPLGPNDMAFIHALTAICLHGYKTSADEDLYIEVADEAAQALICDRDVLRQVYLAYLAWRAARKAGERAGREYFALACQIEAFHRYRMGMAVGARDRVRDRENA